jgi:hypothetical protein
MRAEQYISSRTLPPAEDVRIRPRRFVDEPSLGIELLHSPSYGDRFPYERAHCDAAMPQVTNVQIRDHLYLVSQPPEAREEIVQEYGISSSG